MKCYKCGNELPEGALFCDNCGSKAEPKVDLPEVKRFCANCGCELEGEAVFCGNCGASVNNESSIQSDKADFEIQEDSLTEANEIRNAHTDVQAKKADGKKGKGKRVVIYTLLAIILALICTLAVLFIAPKFAEDKNPTTEEYVQSEDDEKENENDEADINEIDADEIEAIIDDNSDYTQFGIYVRNLNNGYEYGYNEESVFLASAMCQVVILDTLSRTVEQKGIDIAAETMFFEYIPNGKEAPSSPSEDDTYLSLERFIEDVAVYGDNNKSNYIVDYIGYANDTSSGFTVINNMLRNNGYNNTKINRKTFINPDYVDYTAAPNTTTPFEISEIFENLVNHSSFGTANYMKSIFRSVSNNGQAIGLKKFVPDTYNVCNVNAFTSESTNNVAIIDDGETEIVVAVLSSTDESKTSIENNDSREGVLKELIEYIIETQFEY